MASSECRCPAGSPGQRATRPRAPGVAAVTIGNADGEIGGLTISDPPTQAEVQALRDKCEELADDVRALAALGE